MTFPPPNAPNRRPRTGFTLIELLIVVVIIGILAAIAVPKFATSKGKAYMSSLKSDLRNLATAQESYFYVNSTYTSNLADLGFTASSGAVLTIAPGATAAGWSAWATHPAANPLTCELFIGNVVPTQGIATREGVVACR